VSAKSGEAQDPLPLLIELREYARLRHEGNATSYLEYLHHDASVRWHFDQAQLDSWLKTNPSVVLFDGLDEVFDPTLQNEVSTAIHRFADQYTSAHVLVTSRVIGYQQVSDAYKLDQKVQREFRPHGSISYQHHAWRDEGFRHFMLQELDDAQIEDFLSRWHRGAYEEARDGDAKRALLAPAILESAAIRQLLRTG
jgi:predicted NACHT family NTPase